MNPELLGVLTSFSQRPVASTAGMSAAFLQTETDERDTDALCFLRITERASRSTNVTECTWRTTRVPFGAAASPFLLAAAIRHRLEKYKNSHAQTGNAPLNTLDADDWIRGEKQLHHSSKTGKKIPAAAGRTACEWKSASCQLRNKWQEEDATTSQKEADSQTSLLRALGISWSTDMDEFTFERSTLIDVVKEGRGTKRDALKNCIYMTVHHQSQARFPGDTGTRTAAGPRAAC